MKPFQLYKHKNCTDVALMPVKSPRYSTTRKVYKLKVRWFNIVNPKNVFDMNVGDNGTDNVEIREEDLKNWRPYDVKV